MSIAARRAEPPLSNFLADDIAVGCPDYDHIGFWSQPLLEK